MSSFRSPGPPDCYALALGPSPSAERTPLEPPAWLALLPEGRLGGNQTIKDSLVVLDSVLGHWMASNDSVWVAWTPHWLGGLMYLRLVSDSGTLRGRYSLHGHQVDDGRLLFRGEVRAAAIPCDNGHVTTAPGVAQTIERLEDWRESIRPDTGVAVAESFRAFEAFLSETPIHSLSLMNYRIATFACRNERLPANLTELQRAAPDSPSALRALDERAWRDAWNRPLVYRRRDVGYEVRSAGPDGVLDSPDDLVSAEDAPLRRTRDSNCQ